MNADLPRVAVLISGQGRNLLALLQAQAEGRLSAQIVAVISNRADAAGLAHAAAAGVPTFVLPHSDYAERAQFDAALAATLETLRPDIVVLAGFMRILGEAFIGRFRGRLLNIHPSLLPKYPGLHTHRRALEAGDAEHGATVHFVTEQLDGGAAIVQGRLTVRSQESATNLAERVMQDIEVNLYPRAVALLARREVELRGDDAWYRGKPLRVPLELAELEKQS